MTAYFTSAPVSRVEVQAAKGIILANAALVIEFLFIF